MPRLLGVDIPGKKKIEYSLRYIYGIGPARSRAIVEALKLDPNMRADDLTEVDALVAHVSGVWGGYFCATEIAFGACQAGRGGFRCRASLR